MSEIVRDKKLALLKKKEASPAAIENRQETEKSQSSLKRKSSGSILGRVDSLFGLKQSGLTKKIKKENNMNKKKSFVLAVTLLVIGFIFIVGIPTLEAFDASSTSSSGFAAKDVKGHRLYDDEGHFNGCQAPGTDCTARES